MVRSRRQRGYALVLTATGVLGGVGSVLLIFHLLKPDPSAVRAGMIRELKDLQARAGNDPEILDAGFDAILADEGYRKYGAELRRQVEKTKPGVHAAAIAQREARRDCEPYLAGTRNVPALPAADLERLRDEGTALLTRHGGTRPGEIVERRVREIEARRATEAPRGIEPLRMARLQSDTQRDLREGRFAAARDRATEMLRTPGIDPDGYARLQAVRESVEKAAAARAESVLAKAREQAAAGRRAEALRLLEEALPQLSGFPQGGPLEALARELR